MSMRWMSGLARRVFRSNRLAANVVSASHAARRASDASVAQHTNRHAFIEPLEGRQLLSAAPTPAPGNYVISFYGLGGPGGLGNDWLDNVADRAGQLTGSTVRKYWETDGGRAMKDLFHSIDRNHDHVIQTSEVKTLKLRVVGYSFGGVQAVNFARYLDRKGSTIKGYRLDTAVPIRTVVAIDPVNSTSAKHTVGVPSNVKFFDNYYQRKAGNTTVQLFSHEPPHSQVSEFTVYAGSGVVGDELTSNALHTTQTRIDSGPLADTMISQVVQDGMDGHLMGKDVDHGTMPLFVYDWALSDLRK